MAKQTTLRDRIGELEVKVDGNGGKGIHRRIDELEERTSRNVAREEFLQAIHGIEQKIEKAFEKQRKTARWIIEQIIRFAPWIAVGISLYLLAKGQQP